MNEIENIRSRVFGKDSSLDPEIFWMCNIMQEFGYTIQEMKSMHITTFKILINYLIEQRKKMNQSMKGGRHR